MNLPRRSSQTQTSSRATNGEKTAVRCLLVPKLSPLRTAQNDGKASNITSTPIKISRSLRNILRETTVGHLSNPGVEGREYWILKARQKSCSLSHGTLYQDSGIPCQLPSGQFGMSMRDALVAPF